MSRIHRIDFQFHHFRSWRKINKIISTLEKETLKVEIFDVSRYIYFLKRRLCHVFYKLSNLLSIYIWAQTQFHCWRVFNRHHQRQLIRHKKKLDLLILERNRKYINNIKPINFLVNNNNKGILTSIRFDDNNNSRSQTMVHIDPHNFSLDNTNPIDQTNDSLLIFHKLLFPTKFLIYYN